MKTFIPNNKWVMTAALLAVLGLNVSLTEKTSREGFSADFASNEMKEGEITTEDGVFKVPYYKGEGDQVIALVKRNAEGNFCTDCKVEAITLTSKNFADISKLNVDLLKQLKDTKIEVPEKKNEEVIADGEEGEEKIANNILDTQVLDKCDNKRSDSDKLTCLTDKFVSVLKRNAKKISDDEALEFYEDNIAGLIESQVKDARDGAVKQYRAFTGRNGASLYDLDPSDEDYADPEEAMEAALEAIQELHAGIPSLREGKDRTRRFDKLRKEIIDTEKTIVAQHAKDVKQAMAAAEANKNSANYSSYLAEANLLSRSLPEVIDSLSSTTNTALRDAVSSEYMRASEAKAQLDSFLLSSGNIQNSLNKFLTDWAVTGRLDTSGLNTVPVGVDLNGRITGAANRGNGVLVSPSTALSSALSSRSTQNIFVPGTTQLQVPATNNGIEFGQLVPLTQENATLRDQLRSQIILQRGL